MRLKLKTIITVCVLLVCVLALAGCSGAENPYAANDRQNYTVSIKFDANGGVFTTNTSVIVDSYNLQQLSADASGKVQLALRSPDDASRGNDAFAPARNGYFLAGWYVGKTETLDDSGNPVTVYSDRWEFDSDRFAVDPSKTYTASEPVLTLYAAWVPLFEVEFYDRASGQLLHTLQYDPTINEGIAVPAWNEKTGDIDMHDFPKKDGYTFDGASYDADGSQPVNTEYLQQLGTVDYTNGTAKNATTKVYVDYMEGKWYHIYNVEQFLDNASVNGSYVIHADLDFAGKIWPTSLMYGNFSGTIQGNGHTFSNITATQTNNSKVNAGLFGQLTENAVITDLKLSNATFTIQSGTRVVGTSFGLLAGTISEQATITGVQIENSTLQIDSKAYFGVDDYVIGLVCGSGNAAAVDHSGIICQATGENPGSLSIQTDGNTVTLEIISE